METGIGDRLARGMPTAQFAGASADITQFENDFIYMDMQDLYFVVPTSAWKKLREGHFEGHHDFLPLDMWLRSGHGALAAPLRGQLFGS